MSCTLKEELLALHAGGDLPVAEAAEVEQHVLQCDHCAHELAAYRSARESLQALRGEEAASPGLWEELDARLDVIDATSRHQRPWYARYGLGAPLAAAAALLLTLQFLPDNNEVAPAGVGNGDGSIAMEEGENPQLRRADDSELAELLEYTVPAQINGAESEGLVSRQVNSEDF